IFTFVYIDIVYYDLGILMRRTAVPIAVAVIGAFKHYISEPVINGSAVHNYLESILSERSVAELARNHYGEGYSLFILIGSKFKIEISALIIESVHGLASGSG